MRFRLAFNSRILPRTAVPAVQGNRIMKAAPTRTFATIGSHPTTDQMGTPRPKTKWGMDRETLYIGGGLAAIGGLWYYYATVEHARIEKKRGLLDPHVATTSAANVEGSRKRPAEDTKGRAQEALKNVQ